MPLSRSLTEVLNAARDSTLDGIKKCIPATVTAVHASRQTVDVQIAIKNPLFDEYGAVAFEKAPSFADVPLGVMRGGGFLVWVPVQVGDSVLLVFSDLSTDTWRSGNGSPVPPGWVGKHTTDSPFALPCVAPDASFLSSPGADPGKLIIGKDGATAQIKISASDIELGGIADAVGLASKINAAVTTIVNAFNTHTHPAPGGATSAPTVPISPAPPSVASTIVKCG